MTEKILMNEFKALDKESWTNISLVNENIFDWSVALIVLNPDSPYYGGYFKARMSFPHNYRTNSAMMKVLRGFQTAVGGCEEGGGRLL